MKKSKSHASKFQTKSQKYTVPKVKVTKTKNEEETIIIPKKVSQFFTEKQLSSFFSILRYQP